MLAAAACLVSGTFTAAKHLLWQNICRDRYITKSKVLIITTLKNIAL